MEIHRVEAGRINGDEPGRYFQGAAQGNAEVGEVAAYPGTGKERVFRRIVDGAGAGDVADAAVNPFGYRLHPCLPGGSRPNSATAKPTT